MATSIFLRRRAPPYLRRYFTLLNSNSPTYSSPKTTSFRFYSSDSPDSVFNHELNSVTESELRNLGFLDGADSFAYNGLIEDSIFPIRAVVNFLDGYHDLTGLPWWIVIASSTVALRVTLLPLIILQLQKLKQIGQSFRKLPPPFPPLLSGRSYVDHFSLFRKERKALGCPSYLWFIASPVVQVPCFIVWMVSIRRMALADFPGFDNGGILWFQDLTVSANGPYGCIFPFIVAGLHFCNVQITLGGSSVDKQTGMLELLGDWYRKYLQVLTVAILFGAFHVPQGSLIYWMTNSSFTFIQHICLRNPTIRKKLGLVIKDASHELVESEKDENGAIHAPSKKGPVSAFDLSPLVLLNLAVNYLSTGKTEKATVLLRLAVEKDPECYKAWTLLGNIMIQKGLFDEAFEYSECAISKISLLEEPYTAEAVDFLIQASMIAGGALYRQGKLAESLVHFKRVRDMKEPEDPVAKARYYEGLVGYASILINEGRKEEGLRYLNLAIAFDPQYSMYLNPKNTPEKDADEFVGDLARSRTDN